MKIRTITCHDVYNHGASLQAYALQTYLISLGHDVRIIDYKPDYLSGHYRLCSIDNPIYNRPIVRQLYLLAKLPGRLIALKRKQKFDKFTKKYLKLTNIRYCSNEELKSNPPIADAYIAGSDQIWNTLFQNGRDAAFYLDFAPQSAKRISYAASFATEDVIDKLRPFVGKMLQNFNSISIRERNSLLLLASLGRTDGVAVCDPVFLLSRIHWEKILTQNRYNDRYLLVYDSEDSLKVRKIAETIAKEKALQIYNISAVPVSYADKDFWASSPLDFVQLVRDAQYVVSNSFHASAFSIIFERDFCVVNRTECINERMKSLLASYGLEKRLVSEYSMSLLASVNYQKVRPLLQKDIIDSKEFLHQSL